MYVSTHDLTKRSTYVKRFQMAYHQCFNSRPHEEVDHNAKTIVTMIPVFQLTTSRRGRRLLSLSDSCILAFQLTTSRRGRLLWLLSARMRTFRFNSRPHEEVDRAGYGIVFSILRVSTHDLTKRSTGICYSRGFLSCSVSTHDLTKRSTCLLTLVCNSVPSVSTHDLTKRSTSATNTYRRTCTVSTHDLTKRSTAELLLH